MRLIYRIEDDKGKGVFDRLIHKLPSADYHRAMGHPGPTDRREQTPDGECPLSDAVRNNHRFVFGFHQAALGRSWFSEAACRTLDEAGGVLKVHVADECPLVVRGNFQCVFLRAEWCASLPVAALYWPKTSIVRAIINQRYPRKAA